MYSKRGTMAAVVLIVAAVLFAGYGDHKANAPKKPAAQMTNMSHGNDEANEGTGVDKAAMSDPDNVAVLVHKQYFLPDDYEPEDLVYPDVPFTLKEKIEKRMMRQEAAEALEALFAGAAKTYSAVPVSSEHETGLAIDVSGRDGKCAAESCFGGTKEADWLAEHATEYGFIIRYPEGKDDIQSERGLRPPFSVCGPSTVFRACVLG